jgi:hypothetical protein
VEFVTFGICVVAVEQELMLLQALILGLILRVSMSRKMRLQEKQSKSKCLTAYVGVYAVEVTIVNGDVSCRQM